METQTISPIVVSAIIRDIKIDPTCMEECGSLQFMSIFNGHHVSGPL